MIDKDVFEELLESTLGEIEERTEVDVSENSFTRKINEILLKSNAETMALLKENVKNNIDLLQRFKNKCVLIMQDEIKFINENNYSTYYLYKKKKPDTYK